MEGRPTDAAKPLCGRTIVVTRAKEQAAALTTRLVACGAEVIEFPTIRVDPPGDPQPLRRAAREAAGYDCVVFTSVNGVAAFLQALRDQGPDARALRRARVCAVGPATARALEDGGVAPDLIPERFIAEGVVEALAASDALHGRRILLPRAAVARPELPDGLAA